MKIYILDKFKITKFNLPQKIEDSFLIPYSGNNNKEDNFVTVEADNDKWQLKSNGNVNILVGTNMVENVMIEEYDYYALKILGQEENATLFALPSKETESYKLDLKNLTSITIGSSQNVNISYRNNLTAELHAEIKFINNDWYLAASADDSFRTYINSERVLTAKLNVGDIIFINGLKIIWMKSFIKINNPKHNISVTGLQAYEELDAVDNTKYSPVTDEEANAVLYTDEDYFYHVPRIVPTIDYENINIDSPPNPEKIEDIPFLLSLGTSITMLASSGMMIYNIVNSLSSGKSFIQVLPQFVMCISMLIGSIVMPRVLKAYQKNKKRKKEKERQVKYKAYLDKMDTKIQYALKKQTQILKENNLSVKECYNVIMNKNRKLWTREVTDDDFLRVRLGSGDIDSYVRVNAPQEKFTLEEDNLQEMVFEVDKKSKKLLNVPVTLNLADQTVLAFLFNGSYKNDYVNGLLTQILAFHSSNDLKLVVFTNEQNKKKWEFIKFIPHCWSEDKTKRFFATNSDEYKEVANYLDEQLKLRKENLKQVTLDDSDDEAQNRKKMYKANPPYYLIITDDYKSIKNFSIIQSIQNDKINIGFSLITLSNSMKNLPNKCEKFVQIGEKESCVFEKKLTSQSQIIFNTEYEKNLDMNLVGVQLLNIPTETKDASAMLPNNLSFLEMYRVSKIEQLNIFNRWQTNNPVISLSTPIGVHSNGEQFKLDLHEKYHGPHGLIAGSTGSGKSEFIITYILSMCVNYHPYEVQFVLIDYKGGGLAGAFENKETGVKVPHLVGTITNLDTAEMNRTLVSISSELKRRQKKFNEVKDRLEESTMDIYKYQKFYREGLIEEPMAHLFIISDEFAELKSQQPEFLQELVSTARIGRSLGVHLILATQKPSGVVNDQIWSNSKFKVCLKVQSRSDSMEMLKRPEAASIKDAGRFYLQVGYDDFFDIGQSGWGGAKYVPTDKIIKKADDSISYINNTGNIIKSINDVVKRETTEDLGEQLTNVVKYIHKLSQKENVVTNKMWLDKIPEIIFINDIKNKYYYKPTPYIISPVIGEYDSPSTQSQGILNLNLDQNILIYGKGGSGKENLISTILWSATVEHTPSEVNFYVIDCGAETLKMFYKVPHVGEVMNQDEGEKIVDTFNMIAEEIERRKDEYSDYAGSYENYCENSGKRDPLIVTIINNYEVFVENFGKLADQIQTLYRDGSKYGVTFIISCIASNGIRGKMVQYFNKKIVLQMPNPDDYRAILSIRKGLVPSSCFGRGLVETDNDVLEFQTANICDIKQMNNVIKEVAKQMDEAYVERAKKVPTIPNIVTLNSFENASLNEFPVGYNIFNKSVVNYDLLSSRFLSIVSEDMNMRLDFLKAFIKQLKTIENINIKIVDFVKAFKNGFEDLIIYADDFDNAMALINNEIASENNSEKINYYIFIGIGEFETNLTNVGQQILNNIFMASKSIKKSYFMFVDNYSSYRSLQLVEWYKTNVEGSNAIWLGQNIANQMIFSVPNVNMDIRNLNFPCLGFVIEKNNFNIIKYVVDTEGKDAK